VEKSDLKVRAESLRSLAEEARAVAAGMKNAEARRTMLRIGESYDQMAEIMDGLARQAERTA
jgi:hypothetical protein